MQMNVFYEQKLSGKQCDIDHTWLLDQAPLQPSPGISWCERSTPECRLLQSSLLLSLAEAKRQDRRSWTLGFRYPGNPWVSCIYLPICLRFPDALLVFVPCEGERVAWILWSFRTSPLPLSALPVVDCHQSLSVESCRTHGHLDLLLFVSVTSMTTYKRKRDAG